MSSILTNMAAMSAVQNLTATQQNLQSVENQISTGLKVATAKDNAAYWSIATSMKTTTGELSAVSDSLNLGSSVLATASSALSNVVSVLQKMAAELVSAQQAGTDLNKIGTDITQLQVQLTSTINSASFNGVNLLNQSSTTTTQNSIVTSVSGSGTTFQVNMLYVTYSSSALTTTGTGASTGVLDRLGTNYTQGSILTLSVATGMTSGQLALMSKDVDLALSAVENVASTIGAYQTNVGLQSTFIAALSDSITSGVGSLEDADMNKASTRLNALQTQQQLGVQALSVANQNSQMILKLFG